MLVMTARVLDRLVAWPVRSQHQSRRNALIAATALAERRREREEVEEFLERRATVARRTQAMQVAVAQAR